MKFVVVDGIVFTGKTLAEARRKALEYRENSR